MEDYEWNECALTDIEAIKTYLSHFSAHQKEMVLLQDGEPVGAILTKAQYAWFLDQIDRHQNWILLLNGEMTLPVRSRWET